jgi:hypothetical protein
MKDLAEERAKRLDWHFYGPSSPEEREYVDKASALLKLLRGDYWLAWQAPHYDETHPNLKYTFILGFRVYRYKTAKNMYDGAKRAMDKLLIA